MDIISGESFYYHGYLMAQAFKIGNKVSLDQLALTEEMLIWVYVQAVLP